MQRFLNANLEAPCGAKVKPFIDLTIAPNFGDKKVTNKVGLVTTGTLDSFDARITNNAMYKGKVGVETTKGKHSFGLNYGIGGGNRGSCRNEEASGHSAGFAVTESYSPRLTSSPTPAGGRR